LPLQDRLKTMTENKAVPSNFNSVAGTIQGMVAGPVSVSDHGLQVTQEAEIRALNGENAVELINRSITGSIINAGNIVSEGGGGIVIKGATLVGDIVNLGQVGAGKESQDK
jgi:hypothetical protein